MKARIWRMALALWFLGAGLAHAERMAVTAPKANVRVGPGSEHAVIWQTEQYYPVEVRQRKGPWILFEDFEGDRGWLHQSLLGKVDAVITVKNGCNLRGGPGETHPVVLVVDAGVPFKVLERKGTWLRVRHGDGEEGWIARSLVW